MLEKIIRKIRDGSLKDLLSETKWIYAYASGYRKGIAMFIFLGILSTAAGLTASVVSKHLIDAVTGFESSRIVLVGLAYVFCHLFRLVLSLVIKRLSAKLSVRASNEIRADVFSRFLDIDWQASLDYHSGDLLSRIGSDVSTVADSVLGWIPSLVTGIVQFLAILCVILYYDPVMALLALVSAPFTVILSRFLLSKIRSFGRKVRESQAKLTSFYEEALQNLQAIKSFSLKTRFKGTLSELQALYRGIALDYNLFSVKANFLMSLMSLAVTCLCLAWGIFRLWTGRISFGTMVLFIQLAGLLSSSFSGLVSLIPSAISATVSARRIMTILELPSEDENISPEAEAVLGNIPENGVSVSASGVRFSYRNGRTVFSDLNLCACPSEIIGVVSPSGGGKTTLIRMLLGLIFPESGTLLLSSGNASCAPCPALRPAVTYVAQEKIVFSGTVADTLRLANASATDDELREALRTACALDFVEALPDGLETVLGERGSGLSDGQLQRLAIARALLSPAPLMLLDEATSSLDMPTERQIMRNLSVCCSGRTVIFTTHRPAVLSACSRVYSINDGSTSLMTDEEVRKFIFG